MPFFGGKKNKSKENLAENPHNTTYNPPPRPNETPSTNGNTGQTQSDVVPRHDPPPQPRPKLVFHCQQAHGSPTGIISGFTNVKELYQKIAECYDMAVEDAYVVGTHFKLHRQVDAIQMSSQNIHHYKEVDKNYTGCNLKTAELLDCALIGILFCTLNTHKIDMGRLLGGQIGLEDFIFAHIKGQPKEVEVTKSEDALGLTITDNGAGYAFIKRIKEGSIMDKTPLVAVGDHIEKIDGKSLVGCRHFEVAKMLKEIPKGTTFLIRTVEPLKSGFSFVGQATGKKGSSSIGTGKQTLRLSSKGQAKVEVPDDVVNVAVDKINGLLEAFMGINDTDLAQSIWEAGCKKDNPHDFAVAIDESDLGEFGFTDDFVFDLWGAISDAKSGRLAQPDIKEFSEQF